MLGQEEALFALARLRVCACACVYVNMCIYVCMYYVHVFMPTACMYVCMYMDACMHVFLRAHTICAHNVAPNKREY